MARAKTGASLPHCYEFPMVSVAVDCAVFGWDINDGLHVLLIERGEKPFGHALPGGFVRAKQENLETAARRELEEETGVRNAHLEQFHAYGDPGRDDRGNHVISVAFFALVRRIDHKPRGGTDADTADWYPIQQARSLKLAFDHQAILSDAIDRLFEKLRHDPIAFKLLPRKFRLREVQLLYETARGQGDAEKGKVDKRNFRKKMLEMGLLEDTGETESDVRHRAARLYRFNNAEYEKKSRQGWKFDI